MSLSTQPHTRILPLFVDLDGTLIHSDCLWEGLLLLLRSKPWAICMVPLWILRGKSYFKHQVAICTALNPESLPYNQNVLAYIHRAKATGRKIILATATDEIVAAPIAHYLGIFDDVIATKNGTNNSNTTKLAAIKVYTKDQSFDYIGNSSDDLPIWKAASHAVVVTSSAGFTEKVRACTSSVEVLEGTSFSLMTIAKAMRVYQWVKNTLLFVPLVLAHRFFETELLLTTGIAFLCFSLCASSVYILNDLLDLESDRLHIRKKKRPFASGKLPISLGVLLVPMLIATSFVGSYLFVSQDFTLVLLAYFAITTAYTFVLKKIAIVDVLLLAGLYAFRLFAGAIAGNVMISQWLIAFSVFIFLSLAFVKRYSELIALISDNKTQAKGRAYTVGDVDLLRSVGTACGLVSILIFAFYINSREVTNLYHRPQLLWGVGICLLYWILRVWFVAHRGQMHDDPIIFTVKDKASYVVVAVLVTIVVFAL